MTTSVLEPWDTEAMTNYSPSIGKRRQVGDIPITLSRRLWTMRSAAGKEITAAIFDLLIGGNCVSHTEIRCSSRVCLAPTMPTWSSARRRLRTSCRARAGSDATRVREAPRVRGIDEFAFSSPFEVLVMSEESRLGREPIETAYALKRLISASVRLFFYLEGRERTFDSPIEKVMLSIQTMADEMVREKASQRMVDTMTRKARAGHVTAGKCFGYENVMVNGADGQRSHVEQRLNDAEAAVIRRIFAIGGRR